MIEVLAPCGGADHLSAALGTGADAVYFGATDFSARKNARNFTPEEARAAIRLCHASGVKVHIAMNTLLYDDELSRALKTAEALYEMGADALIVQDLGFTRLLREAIPDLPLHASTQLTVTSAAGAEFARKVGFRRVVLAREMSLDEIERVVKSVGIETEVFIHGALCVSLSGQCLMSAFYGGRSGNRGECAQPCRLRHTCGGREYVLSLKDLSAIELLPRLDEIGVTSAKIEGRMKRPEYVASAVSAARAALNGEAPDLALLRAVFSRSGFTSAYLDASLTEMGGTRTREDAESAAPVLKEIRRLYDKPYKRYTADVSIRVARGEP
ncbi:MAG: U32 family peptidase, partial [Eubacterium sp.]|nr:U32 family peptidase [Eubacterium sp.]